MRLLTILPVLPVLLGIGCKPSSNAPVNRANWSSGSKTWTHATEGMPVPGLDEGACTYHGRSLMIWTDSTNIGSSSTNSDSTQGLRGDGRLKNRTGRNVTFSFHLPSEDTGSVVIDSVDFDVTKGRLFLVKTEGPRTTVKQVDRDLSTIDLGLKDFQQFGRKDAVIRGFFEEKPAK